MGSAALIGRKGTVLPVGLEGVRGGGSMPGRREIDPTKILLYPIGTEKAMRLLDQNKIVFEVDRRATKRDIKEAFEKLFNVKVEKVNVAIVRGRKKAYIKLKPEFNAVEIATNLGLL